MSFPMGDVVVGVGPERALRGRPVTGHDLEATGSGRLENQATEAGPDRRRRHNRVDKPRPGHPKRSKAIHESHGVVATTPILSASPGPATTNTYMRFNGPFSLGPAVAIARQNLLVVTRLLPDRRRLSSISATTGGLWLRIPE